ncbi:MAG: hypothetical protein RL173_2290 [Fibrobacterota bacterium]|jgi:predicted metal-dependent HD superfamily phosphohydrolase
MVVSSRLSVLLEDVRIRLFADLPSTLTYHGPHHTLDDVLPAVDRICSGEGVPPRDRDLVVAAALFHDIGFVESYNGNEAIGARIAAEMLPGHGFSAAEIARILDIIMSTEMREVDGAWIQVPGDDLLKKILCDADLDNLGRDDFFQVSDNLRQELVQQGKVFADLDWYTRQILFVSQQKWFTSTQRADREETKQRNLASLRQELAKLL